MAKSVFWKIMKGGEGETSMFDLFLFMSPFIVFLILIILIIFLVNATSDKNLL
jgi:hypothetical protein